VVIQQGDVFWLHFGGRGSSPRGRRPGVIVQHDRYNRSLLGTVVVAAVTSNLELAFRGNVRLRKGEANLPRPSVVNVTQLWSIDRADLLSRVGTLSRERLREVLIGVGGVFGLELPSEI
jgi:mRNA interferase MazF